MSEQTKPEVKYATQYDVDYLYKRLGDLRKQIRMIIAVLIDKKIISPELGKRIEESKPEEAIDWIFEFLEKKE